VLHSVTNPIRRLTGTIHVYGGDFFEPRRSEWDSETLRERAFASVRDVPGRGGRRQWCGLSPLAVRWKNGLFATATGQEGESMPQITEPTLLLNESICRANISRMAAKAARSAVRFRPHFKTHQSLAVGEWLREAGAESITVSSVKMAAYFSGAWSDITIAIPFNVLETERVNGIRPDCALNLCVMSVETIEHLERRLRRDGGRSHVNRPRAQLPDRELHEGLHDSGRPAASPPRRRPTSGLRDLMSPPRPPSELPAGRNPHQLLEGGLLPERLRQNEPHSGAIQDPSAQMTLM
jgi:hypothetical protein